MQNIDSEINQLIASQAADRSLTAPIAPPSSHAVMSNMTTTSSIMPDMLEVKTLENSSWLSKYLYDIKEKNVRRARGDIEKFSNWER